MVLDDIIVRQIIPQTVFEVEGEVPLGCRLQPWADTVEAELCRMLPGAAAFFSEDADRLHTQYVVYEAMQRAVPSLDLVVTPNGFGVVSTADVAPASKERVAALRSSLAASADAALSLLISAMLSSDWAYDEVSATARASLMSAPARAKMLARPGERLADSMSRAALMSMPVEQMIQERYFGPSVTEACRFAAAAGRKPVGFDESAMIVRVAQTLADNVTRMLMASEFPASLQIFGAVSAPLHMAMQDAVLRRLILSEVQHDPYADDINATVKGAFYF